MHQQLQCPQCKAASPLLFALLLFRFFIDTLFSIKRSHFFIEAVSNESATVGVHAGSERIPVAWMCMGWDLFSIFVIILSRTILPVALLKNLSRRRRVELF